MPSQRQCQRCFQCNVQRRWLPGQRNGLTGHPTMYGCNTQDTLAGQRRQSLAQLSGIRSKIGVWETKVVNPSRPRPKGADLLLFMSTERFNY